MENIITIKVKEERKIPADTACITLSIKLKEKRMEMILLNATKQVSTIMSVLAQNDISKEQILLNEFNITATIEKTERGILTKNTLNYFVYSQTIDINIAYEEAKVIHLTNTLLNIDENFGVKVLFYTAHKEEVIDDMMNHLGLKAYKKAESLLNGTGATIGNLYNVTYDVNSYELTLHSESKVSYSFKEFISPIEDDIPDLITRFTPKPIDIELKAIYSWLIKN